MANRSRSTWVAQMIQSQPSTDCSDVRAFLYCQKMRIGKSRFEKRRSAMSIAELNLQVNVKLDAVRAALAREITGASDVCLTCSFQAEDVLLTKLAIELDARIPILFLDTG